MVALLVVAGLLAGCGVRPHEGGAPIGDPAWPRVYLLGQGWHSGLIIPRAAGRPELWPERADFPDAAFVEIGWGQREFYQAQDPGVLLALEAALWPSSSVVFLAGFRYPPAEVFPCSDLIELVIAPTNLERLLRYVHESFDRSGGGAVSPLAPGASNGGLFYPALGRFHLFNTCNTWTAGALRAAGYPIEPPYPMTSGGLVDRVRPLGTVIAPRAVCLRARAG